MAGRCVGVARRAGLLLSLPLSLTVPAWGDETPLPPAALAVVGDRVITVADVREEFARGGRASPGSGAELRARLEAMVLEHSLVAVARAAGYEQRPEVRRSLDRLLAAQYRAAELEPRLAAATVADGEVERYYAEHPDEFLVPRRVRGAVVLVAVPPRADARARRARREVAERALDAARGLPATAPGFGQVAVTTSDDRATRYRGGETGWVAEAEMASRWGAEAARALFALEKPGELGPVVESAQGFLLVKLLEDRPAAARPLAEVRELVRRRLLLAKQGAEERTFAAAVLERAGARVSRDALERAVAELDAQAKADPGASAPPPLPASPAGPGN